MHKNSFMMGALSQNELTTLIDTLFVSFPRIFENVNAIFYVYRENGADCKMLYFRGCYIYARQLLRRRSS